MEIELKKPASYQEQINILKNVHGLTIHDDEDAVRILSKLNYYRLSAYGLGLKKKEDRELYEEGVSIETLYDLYVFDKQFRSLLFSIIEEIETILRTKVAYHISMKYGSEGHINERNFNLNKVYRVNGESIYYNFLAKFEAEVKQQKDAPFVKHHVDKYNGHFPTWVAVELCTFGMLSMLYSVMLLSDQKDIAAHFQTSPFYFESWLVSLVEVRNICAHYGRLYNRPLTKAPRLYNEFSKYTCDRIFPLLIIIARMVGHLPIWRTFSEGLTGAVESHESIKLGFIGFPSEWEKVLEAAAKKAPFL